jgi:tetratricopeptide (TPR) repeat protein
MTKLSYSYYNQDLYEEAKIWYRKTSGIIGQASVPQIIYFDLLKATLFEPPQEEIRNAQRLLAIDDQLPTMYYRIGVGYNQLQQYERAIPEFEKSLDINKKWGTRPDWVLSYVHLEIAYDKTGQFKKEMRLYRRALKDFPVDPSLIIQRQAILSLIQKDNKKAEKYIASFISEMRKAAAAETAVYAGLAVIYSAAGLIEKSEEHYRMALSCDPGNITLQKNMAYFLIDSERDINEGLMIIEKILQTDPDDYICLEVKGCGLFKLGKKAEALVLLERSWQLKPVYNHRLFLHYDEAKRAARQN